MAKFTLYYHGATLPSPEDHKKIAAVPGLVMLEDALPRLWVVEADEASLAKVIADLPGWEMTLEIQIDPGKL